MDKADIHEMFSIDNDLLIIGCDKRSPQTGVLMYHLYHFEKITHKMQETHNNCFGSKKHSTILRQTKTSKHEFPNARYIAVIFWHSYLPVFT